MKSKLVTAYWMDSEGFPFQGANPVRKIRYKGSLISHCIGSNLPVVCYTHSKNYDELVHLKSEYNLINLEIKILELKDVKYHKEIDRVRNIKFDTDLDGRGPEIMWGKFDILERELEGFDRVYWVDVGLQHPGIFPWMFSKVFNIELEFFGIPKNWWSHYDVFNFSNLIDEEIYRNLNNICNDKIMFICCSSPQVSYPFIKHGILDYAFESPYPVGGMIGGDVKILKKYIDSFWNFAEKVMIKDFLCTEEVLMKPCYDELPAENKITFTFDKFATDNHDDFHFKFWDENKSIDKPFYTMWYDIKKNKS
jgi:hypothetical protein